MDKAFAPLEILSKLRVVFCAFFVSPAYKLPTAKGKGNHPQELTKYIMTASYLILLIVWGLLSNVVGTVHSDSSICQ